MLYKERAATIYTRAANIVINNPLESEGVNPFLRFNEETVVKNPDGTVVSQGLNGEYCIEELSYDTMNEEFTLYHPVTDEPIGTATYQDLYTMIRSLYFHATEKRDNTDIEPAEPVDLSSSANLVIDQTT